MKASIVDLRYRMKDVLSAVERGETVTVLHRGKEKAKLVPIQSAPRPKKDKPLTEDQPFFGLWSDRKDMTDPVAYVRKLRADRALPIQPAATRSPRASRKPK